ncbi:MAG: hypothetical protein EA386_02915 [Rhodobacteraceae bacterium]|nr:MAG: hypothetical protein EA386_02915 [Paracoccaceae bacterium]
MILRALTYTIIAALAAGPGTAQETLEIPQEQINALPDLPDLPVPQFDFDLSSPEGFARTIEGFVGTDWTGALPSAVTEAITGATPFEAHAQVVWEMKVSGSWNETLSGGGTLTVLDQSAFGIAPGRQLYALLHTDARDWPFHLFAFVPDAAPAMARLEFSGAGDGQTGGGTGFSGLANHLFQADRVLGYATPQGMTARSFSETTDDDFTGDYLYTEVQGGRVRVDRSGHGYRMQFSALVQEFSSGNRDPTGRSARVRGWVCEAAAHAANPDTCAYDALELIDHTPSALRANVNPQHPAITLTFDAPVDHASLANNFTLFTRDAQGARVEVPGQWHLSHYPGAWRDDAAEMAALIEQATDAAMCSARNTNGLATHPFPQLDHYEDPHEYMFRPTAPLRSGAYYEVRLAGGEDGVQARDWDAFLEQDHSWRFSTLLDMEAQQPLDQDHPLDLRIYQTVRDPHLVFDKPAMTRLMPDWRAHEDIAPAWQPERFEFELVLSERHPRVVAQRDLRARVNRFAWLEPQRAFGDEDRRNARHTVNFFGWLPQRDSADTLELVACPNAPFPFPLSSANTRQDHPIDIWDHDPGDLDFYFAVAEIGPWANELEQFLRELSALDSVLPGLARDTRDALAALAMDILRGRIDEGDLADRMAGIPDNVAETLHDRLQVIMELRAEIEGGISDADRQAIMQTLWRTEHYVPQYLPHRAATAHPLDFGTNSFGLFLATMGDPLAGAMLLLNEAGRGDAVEDNRVAIIFGAYLRHLQRQASDHVGPEDITVVVVPFDALGETAVGMALSNLEARLFKGVLDYRARAVAMEIQADPVLDADVLATGLVHEFGHVFSLPHFPSTVDAGRRRYPTIDGFRLAPSGLQGWNKSYHEGNAEDPDYLRSLMWPDIQPSRRAWVSQVEYALMQADIQAGFGQRDALLRQQAIRTAQAAPSTLSDAQSPPADRIILTGLIAPEGGASLDPLRIRSAPATHDQGPYKAELLDAQGRVLVATAFDTRAPDIHPMHGRLRARSAGDTPLHWPDFRVAIDPHPQAVALRLREGARELAMIEVSDTAPILEIPAQSLLLDDTEEHIIRWSSEGTGPVSFDVEYSPTGAAPWRPLALFQSIPAVTLRAAGLEPGPRPHLRITAQGGLHATRQVIPLELSRTPAPVAVDLPDSQDAPQDIAPSLRFATDIATDMLEEHLHLIDATGTPVAVDYSHLPGQRRVSLLPDEPLAPGSHFTLLLREGLHDMHGNRLGETLQWNFETAPSAQ